MRRLTVLCSLLCFAVCGGEKPPTTATAPTVVGTGASQTSQTSDPMLRISFEGIGEEASRSLDSTIAVSDRTILIARNTHLALRTKTGQLVAMKRVPEFFAPVTKPGEAFFTDPYVTFGPESRRFFLVNRSAGADRSCAAGTAISTIMLGVSKGPNPASLEPSDWHLYALDRTRYRTAGGERFSCDFGDFDHLTVVGDWIVISWAPVDGAGNQGGTIRVLPKGPALSGGPITSWIDWETEPKPRVAATLGSTPWLFIDVRNRCESGGLGWRLASLPNPPPGAPELARREDLVVRDVTTDVPCLTNPHNIFEVPQGGGGPVIDGVIYLSTQPVYRDGSLWLIENRPHDFGSGPVLVIRWVELDMQGWPQTVGVRQSGTIGEAGVWVYAPAIMVDEQRNVVVVYARSSPSEFASAYYSVRLASDPPGTMRPPQILKAGTAVYGGGGVPNRFIDYPHAALDPTDGSLWIIGQAATAGTPQRSTTWVGNLVLR